MQAPFARLIGDYGDLVVGARDRADAMGMTRLEIDEQAGLQSGYSGKLLSMNPVKCFGPVSLGAMLGAIGCKLLLIEDPVQTERILSRRQMRERPILGAAPPAAGANAKSA
jgi:hypothetical protein